MFFKYSNMLKYVDYIESATNVLVKQCVNKDGCMYETLKLHIKYKYLFSVNVML